jgi:hypothetical protein
MDGPETRLGKQKDKRTQFLFKYLDNGHPDDQTDRRITHDGCWGRLLVVVILNFGVIMHDSVHNCVHTVHGVTAINFTRPALNKRHIGNLNYLEDECVAFICAQRL